MYRQARVEMWYKEKKGQKIEKDKGCNTANLPIQRSIARIHVYKVWLYWNQREKPRVQWCVYVRGLAKFYILQAKASIIHRVKTEVRKSVGGLKLLANTSRYIYSSRGYPQEYFILFRIKWKIIPVNTKRILFFWYYKTRIQQYSIK